MKGVKKMESCKEWLTRRVEGGDCKFFPVDKEQMLRVIKELEKGERDKSTAEKLAVLSMKKGVYKHLKHKISFLENYGKETERYLSGEINALFEFGLLEVSEFWELEELINEKYLR